MKYNCGMYGGSFNPLHLGHVRCMIEAANQCKKLIIVISEGVNRSEIDIRIRYRWIYQVTKHIGNVKIFTLSDNAETKEAYTDEYWNEDADKVKAFAGEPIDAVFCGSDYDNNSFWAKCYPDAKLIIFKRNGISSTEIRRDIYGHWEWLPAVVKPYYVKKVLLIGGESTGKSTLTINLANYYNTNYLEEVGRNISERSGTDRMMIADDFTDILLQHKTREIEAVKASNRILFEDTDCLTPFQWFEVLAVIGFTIYFGVIDQENQWWYILISSVAAISGIFCVVLCAAGKKSQYYWGFVNIVAYVVVAWVSKYYGEVMLNALYFLPTQFVGMYFWKKHYNDKRDAVKCKKMSLWMTIVFLAASGVFIWVYRIFLVQLGGKATWLDSASTTFSLIANVLMVLRYREQWILWIIVDVITVVMWAIAGDWIMTTMWAVYLLNACYGFAVWTNMNKVDNVVNE